MGSTDGGGDDGVRSIGPHRVWIEPPDVLHTQIDGDIKGEHVQGLLDALAAFPRGQRIYVLRDARRGGVPSREAREQLVKDLPIDHVTAVISYGAPFQARVILTMLGHAMRVLRPSHPRFLFVDTEADARALIEADRARRA
jgi:hypothetical protein